MIAVIGDIHGCFYTLVNLVEQVKQKYNNIPIYSVGDLIDRGKHSFEVMNFILTEEITFTAGNHDLMFYHFFKKPSTIFGQSWSYNGNEATLKSYEKHEQELFMHIDKIKEAPLFLNLEDCFISHAGVSLYYKRKLPKDFRENLDVLKPFIENDYYDDYGVMWNRDPLLNIGKLQIVGHTKHKDVYVDKGANAAYIDTGAYAKNKLSAVIVSKNEIKDILSIETSLNDVI